MRDRFLRACRGESVDATPVWIMRQAGRYLPEYRAVRAKASFLELCHTPELAVEVTLQPLDRMELDAAILFSDILVVFEGMGPVLSFSKGHGPVIEPAVRTAADVAALAVPDPRESIPYVFETIRLLRRELAGRVPLIGFSGAPYTLASYAVEGGSSKTFSLLKGMMYGAPEAYHGLMDKLTTMVTNYLNAQIEAGVQAVQLFDTWAGVLNPNDYEQFVFPYTKRIFDGLNREGLPVIHYTNGCAALLPLLGKLGADVLAIDWRIDLGTVVDTLGPDVVLQGNLDPCVLYAPEAEIERRAAAVLEQGRRARGHIFNLGHGIHPDVDPARLKALVDAVHRLSAREES